MLQELPSIIELVDFRVSVIKWHKDSRPEVILPTILIIHMRLEHLDQLLHDNRNVEHSLSLRLGVKDVKNVIESRIYL